MNFRSLDPHGVYQTLRWNDEHTLVMLIHGGLRSNDDGPDSFAFQATFRWGKDGKPKVVGVKSVPEPAED
jgi:hypothetical protein